MGDSVEDHAHLTELALIVEGLDLGEHTTVEASGTNDKDGEVGYTAHDGGVGHDAKRHTVHDDVVELRAQLMDERVEAGVHEEFDGIGGNWARGDHRYATGGGGEDVGYSELIVGEIVGETGGLAAESEAVAEGAFADIGVDHHYPFACGGEHTGEVAGGE